MIAMGTGTRTKLLHFQSRSTHVHRVERELNFAPHRLPEKASSARRVTASRVATESVITLPRLVVLFDSNLLGSLIY